MDPFEVSYWHDSNRLGYAGAGFVDGHVAYLHTGLIGGTNFQSGPGWTFVYDDSIP